MGLLEGFVTDVQTTEDMTRQMMELHVGLIIALAVHSPVIPMSFRTAVGDHKAMMCIETRMYYYYTTESYTEI